jgi:hypothetical protein
MKTVARNEALQSRIRHLIRTQHQHERQWWEARQALIAKQKMLDEVLRSVGGAVVAGSEVTVRFDRVAS